MITEQEYMFLKVKYNNYAFGRDEEATELMRMFVKENKRNNKTYGEEGVFAAFCAGFKLAQKLTKL
jgi:hypothetical protein